MSCDNLFQGNTFFPIMIFMLSKSQSVEKRVTTISGFYEKRTKTPILWEAYKTRSN